MAGSNPTSGTTPVMASSSPVTVTNSPPASHLASIITSDPTPQPQRSEPHSPIIDILPSNQAAVAGAVQIPVSSLSTASLPSPIAHSASAHVASSSSTSSLGTSAPPLRHPKPMTAADIYAEAEREQEAYVNRLTRELSLLRSAQNASVVSNTSSVSAGLASPEPASDSHPGGIPIPTSSNSSGRASYSHYRTPSNASLRSQSGGIPLSSSYEARRPMLSFLTRQESNASRRSGNESDSHHNSQQRLNSSTLATPGSNVGSYTEQWSPSFVPGTQRYEETLVYRNELDTAKRENEQLKRRVRELESMVREMHPGGSGSSSHSNHPRSRSTSVSTTASVSVSGAGVTVAGPRDREYREKEGKSHVTSPVATAPPSSSSAILSPGVDQRLIDRERPTPAPPAEGVPEDEVLLGESAANNGLGLGEK